MLKVRVIAVVLIHEGNVVQTRQFKVTNVVGNVKTAVKFFATWDADEIVLIDISPKPWEGMLKCVELVVDNVMVPVTVGGHVKSHDQIRDILLAGGDKVLIRTEAWRRPEFIKELSEKHGSQMIVAGYDWLDPARLPYPANISVAERNEVDPQDLQINGAGEILLNCVGKDGTKEGFDLNAVKTVSWSVGIPVIAMGGCGEPIHALEAVKAGASAVAVGNALHYREHAVVKIKKCLAKHGVPIRDSKFAVL